MEIKNIDWNDIKKQMQSRVVIHVTFKYFVCFPNPGFFFRNHRNMI